MKINDAKHPLHIRILIGAFFIALIAPAFDMLFHVDPTPARNENRALASMPALPASLKALPDTIKDFDSFISDHFGFRNFLIRMSARIKFFVFHASPSDNVLVGKDGWFYTASQHDVELHRNIQPFSEQELNAYVQKLRERQAWAEEIGAQYFYMIGPDSLTINPEHAPDWVTKVHPGSRLDQLLEKARSAGVHMIDFRPALQEGKKLGSVSYHTDSHWNGYGGYIAYREIVNAIHAVDPKVGPVVPFSEYTLRFETRPGLDLTGLMGLQDMIPEASEELYYHGSREAKEAERQGLHFTLRNEKGEDYPVAFVCDSMGGSVLPHLGRQFSVVRALWGYVFNTEEIKRYHPKVVLDMAIERTLSMTWGQADNPQEVRDAWMRKSERHL